MPQSGNNIKRIRSVSWTHEKNGTGKIAKESYGMGPTRKKEKRKTTTAWLEEIHTILREREIEDLLMDKQPVSYTHLDVYKRQHSKRIK